MSIEIIHADSLEWMRGQPAASVDLIIGSPPYPEKGFRYGHPSRWSTADWVTWMHAYTVEATRLARVMALWVVNGAYRNGRYLPACEGLVWTCYLDGIRCERPAIWTKNSTFNRRNWFVNSWEYVLAFRPELGQEYFDWQAIAKAPLYKNGGRFRQRNAHGRRRLGSTYPKGKLVRPRDVFYITVGGGHMGSKLAHENEAPFPERLVEPFILTLCPPGGTVLDPFGGSGTTLAVAARHGRNCISIDVRGPESEHDQIALQHQRLQEHQA